MMRTEKRAMENAMLSERTVRWQPWNKNLGPPPFFLPVSPGVFVQSLERNWEKYANEYGKYANDMLVSISCFPT